MNGQMGRLHVVMLGIRQKCEDVAKWRGTSKKT